MALPEAVFVDIALQVPIRDAPMHTLHGILGIRPKPFDLVRVDFLSVFPVLHILLCAVVDRVVQVALFVQGVVDVKFVREHLAPLFHVLFDDGHYGISLAIGNDFGDYGPAPFNSTEDRAFVGPAPPFPLASEVAAGVSEVALVKFNLSRQVAVFIQTLPDGVAHAKGGRIADADLPLDLFGRNARPCLGELKDDVEPVEEPNPRRFKDGAYEGIGKRSAMLATERLAIRAGIVRGNLLARGAGDAVRPAGLPDEREALCRRAEVVEEVTEGESLVHGPCLASG